MDDKMIGTTDFDEISEKIQSLFPYQKDKVIRTIHDFLDLNEKTSEYSFDQFNRWNSGCTITSRLTSSLNLLISSRSFSSLSSSPLYGSSHCTNLFAVRIAFGFWNSDLA